jgi:hypothetical protein
MSKIEVNAVEPQCGTNLTLGASGDTIIIPSGATISNQGTAAGFGPTGAVSWNTTKITADPNPAVTGVGYFADTTSAAFTITLPSSPSAGAVIGIADYANTFATNNLTVDRNGSNIGGNAFNATLSVNGVSVTFVYVDATQGWIVTDSGQRSNLDTAAYIVATGGTVTCCGDFKIHTFTGPGNFTVCSVGNPLGSNTVDYMVVAGGGSGGASGGPGAGGGGGAGGFRVSNSYGLPAPTMSPLANPTGLPVSATTYPIAVGGGGGGSPTTGPGNTGSNSVFSTITSTGGGGGGSFAPSNRNASPGGSGGGAAVGSCGVPGIPGCKGSGNTPPVSPPQGNDGGLGAPSPTGPFQWSGGGGGGAGAAGTSAPGTANAPGGDGSFVSPSFAVSCAGTPGPVPAVRYFAGGGGGGSQAPGQPNDNRSTGGAGGGSNGTLCSPNGTGNGTANTGGGSGGNGGNSANNSGSGGSGIVIIRYKFQN